MRTLLLYDHLQPGSRKVWDNLIRIDGRLRWEFPEQDAAIIELSKKYNCSFIVSDKSNNAMEYIVGINGQRLYKGRVGFGTIQKIELHFENNEDAIVFKLKYV
jgi:hypothetical protein